MSNQPKQPVMYRLVTLPTPEQVVSANIHSSEPEKDYMLINEVLQNGLLPVFPDENEDWLQVWDHWLQLPAEWFVRV